MRRLLPTIALLGAGLLLLLWGLATLQGLVFQERRDVRAQLDDARQTLAEYARRALQGELSQTLHTAEPELDGAAENPLAPSEGLLMQDAGIQVLPRRYVPVRGTQTPGRELYEALRTGDLDDIEETLAEDADAPEARRLALHVAVHEALRAGDRETVSRVVRQVLQHRARWVLASTNDIPATLAMLDDLYEYATPAEELVSGLLRDGLGDTTLRREGLQQQLLARRGMFTADDFRFLAQRVIALSERAGVEHADFVARVADPPAPTIGLPSMVTGPVLLDGGKWFVEPRPATRVVGITVDLIEIVDVVEQDMRARGLLREADTIALPPLGAVQRLDGLHFEVTAPRLDRAAAAAEERFWLKTTFVAVAAVLALAIAALGILLQHKAARFVELKSDFVATVSHELRTPLASIRLMAETVQRRTAEVPRVRDYPERIVREIDELSFLVENILSFNRLDKGRWVPRPSDVSLRRVLDDVVESLQHYGFSDVQLSTEGVDGLALRADRELLKLLLRNLGKNACTYNERTPIELHVQARREPGWLVIDVTDNGVGIAPAQQRKVFEDFRRGGQSRARGSGLGLSICRKSVAAHGGRISIARSGPEGTTFRIELPESMVIA